MPVPATSRMCTSRIRCRPAFLPAPAELSKWIPEANPVWAELFPSILKSRSTTFLASGARSRMRCCPSARPALCLTTDRPGPRPRIPTLSANSIWLATLTPTHSMRPPPAAATVSTACAHAAVSSVTPSHTAPDRRKSYPSRPRASGNSERLCTDVDDLPAGVEHPPTAAGTTNPAAIAPKAARLDTSDGAVSLRADFTFFTLLIHSCVCHFSHSGGAGCYRNRCWVNPSASS